MRPDGRQPDELRDIVIERDFTDAAAGSVLIRAGKTTVLCTASVDEDVPRWMRGSGKGWVTAEYSMLPGASPERVRREVSKGSPSGRTHEIQIDCDVLQADGGTRTASITAGYLALHDALTRLVQAGTIPTHPLTELCAAISVGIVDGQPVLDLPYVEDSAAEVDMNVVMTESGRFLEVQGTAEGMSFSRDELDAMLDLASTGIEELFLLQRLLIADAPDPRPIGR